MSWDIVVFSSKQKITSPAEVDEELLVPIDFGTLLEENFENILADGEHREVKRIDYSIDYCIDDEPTSNILLNLYGENALYAVVVIAKKYGWQIFDTGCEEMIDLEYPEKNGYENFQNYLRQILKDVDAGNDDV